MSIDSNEPLSLEEMLDKYNNTSSSKETTIPVLESAPSIRMNDSPISTSIGSKTLDFDGFDIETPVDLLYLLDPRIASGEIKLHFWQIRFMLDFANKAHNKENPFQAVVQACNGSGKDKYIIAACAVWLCMRFTETNCPVTSSSGTQLDTQTSVHIDRLCSQANALFNGIWKINYRYYECKFLITDPNTGANKVVVSVIQLFATDEAGKAEGFHPVDTGKRMAIFTSETKSIPPEITEAIERCHGYTHRVDVSSPGLPSGYFFDLCMSGVPRDSIEDIKSVNSTQTLLYKITAYDCPHISQSEINRLESRLPGGKNNPVFKSSILAEFGTTNEMVVIPSTYVHRAAEIGKIDYIGEPFNTGGLDLSDGGDETVLSIRNGNKVIGIEAFRFQDTEDTIDYLQELFKQYSLNSKEALIFADCCGIGKPMLNSLRKKGWKNIRYVDSRHKASENRTYTNLGTELFFHMRYLMERNMIIIPLDKKLMAQLSTRYYKITINNLHALLTKPEQKSRGYPSPDRADSLNLCFWNYKRTLESSVEEKPPFEDKEEFNRQIPVGCFDMREWANRKKPSYTIEQKVSSNSLSELQEAIAEYNRNTRN